MSSYGTSFYGAPTFYGGPLFAIVPAQNSFYTIQADQNQPWATFYGGSISDNVEFKNRPYIRGKRIKLRFYTENGNEPFEIFGFQVNWELLQHRP